MASPKRFATGLLLGMILSMALFSLLFGLQLGVPTASSQWCWELNSRKQQLAANAGTPKLLLAGGSATLFGLSARQIQERTGTPTVNLGTHAALGAGYILHLTRQAARPGDTVLLSLEYELYHDAQTDELCFDYLFARDPGYFWSLPPLERLSCALYIPAKRLKQGLRNRGKAIQAEMKHPYDVRCLNAWGDQTGATPACRPPGKPYLARSCQELRAGLPPGSQGFQTVAAFAAWARAHQIRVLATFPALCPRAEYAGDPARQAFLTIEDFYASLEVPLLGSPEEAMLEPEFFFDTLYHLTEDGARERTDRLLPRLEPLLRARAPAS